MRVYVCIGMHMYVCVYHNVYTVHISVCVYNISQCI